VHAAFTFSHESMLLVGGAVAGSNGSNLITTGVGSTTTGNAGSGISSSGFQPSSLTPQSSQQQRATWQRVADKTLPPGALISFLQKGLQYVGIEESLLQQQQLESSGGKKQSNSGKSANEDSSYSTASFPADFSLLCPASIHALTRRNPPILLTVPPAAAAAAVRARLDAEDGDSTSLSLQLGYISTKQQNAADSSEQRRKQHEPNEHQLISQRNTSLTGEEDRSAEMMQVGEEEASIDYSNTNKRSAMSVPKRSGKKQKTMKASDALPKEPSSFASLEQAMAQLEASKQSKILNAASSSELDATISTDTPGETAPNVALNSTDTTEQSPYLVNGQLGDHYHSAKPSNGNLYNANGDRSESGPRQPRTDERGGGSFSSAADNEEDDEDDDDDGRNQSPHSDDTEEDALAAKPEEILKLDKHQSEVFMCAWNPVFTNLIATGSGDASARIWEMNDMYAKSGLKACTELPHGIETGDKKNKDVTTLEWSTDGLLLATGSYDGIARVWSRTGQLIHTLKGHQGPIFSLKWNRMGSFLLSGSYDKSIIVWNLNGARQAHESGSGGATSSGYIEHQFRDHEAPALDVDWKDNSIFASCSTDRTVHIYNVKIDTPLKVYKGHMDEVNAVKWSPSGKYLASCSDDCTAKVWEVDSDRTEPLYDFVNHDQEIYTVKWSPTGPGSSNPSKMPLLATASFDGSIRLWNILDGSCFGYFNQHRDSVYSVAFSPSGDYLASGSLAGQMYIWDVAKAQYVKSYKGKGDIFEVAWNKEETRVAACFSTNVVAVIDFDRAKLPRIEALPTLHAVTQPPMPMIEGPPINDENVAPVS
jgi:WD40 repeat protein